MYPLRRSEPPICITTHGARPGAEQPVTHAIQGAVDEAANRGGGTVRIPEGSWLTGTIFLRSGVSLELDERAVLLGSTRLEDYPAQKPAYRSFHDAGGFHALIYAENVENIGLGGRGTIDGQGEQFPFVRDEHDTRPRLIQFVSCKNVSVSDLHLRNSAMWMQHYLNCDQVRVSGLQIWNHCNHNNDMIDIDGSRDVVVTHCTSDTDDDGITLKSTGAAPCEDVSVSHCVIRSRCNAIKCGSESTGGFRNVRITDCTIRPTAANGGIYGHPEGISAVSLEIVDGGTLEDVTVARLDVRGTRSPIFIRLADRGRPYVSSAEKPPLGAMRKVLLQDISVAGAGPIGCSITGMPGACIEDVVFERVSIQYAHDTTLARIPPLPPEKAQEYPEATMFGPLPAAGLFMRHARNVSLRETSFVPAEDDPRPLIAIHNATNVSVGELPIAEI